MKWIIIILFLSIASCRSAKDVHKVEEYVKRDSVEFVKDNVSTIQTHIDTSYNDNISVTITEVQFAHDSISNSNYIEKLTTKKIERVVESKGIDTTFVKNTQRTKFHNKNNTLKNTITNEKAKPPRWWLALLTVLIFVILGIYVKKKFFK